jgi:predicted dehydrogenase/sugar phosphate isomerase/epimerase
VTNDHNYPKLHNAMWPGLVGKGPDSEPPIDLDTMIEMTAAADVGGVKFDGVDLFLAEPHTSIDSTPGEIERLAEKIQTKNLVVGSVVAPVWPPVGGGSAMGSPEDRKRFVVMIEKACRIARQLRELGIRPTGVVRIDSASGVSEWAVDPAANTKRIAATFAEACDIAESYGERLAAEGEICWGGMHSWRHMLDLLMAVNRPQTLGFQADMAHTLLYALGANAPEHRLLPEGYDWRDRSALDSALQAMTDALRPWTIDFHVAQNDATVKGMGSHDKTGRHCMADDSDGKLDLVRDSGWWLRNNQGPTRAIRHICWDGCMFPNAVMLRQQTWNDILAAMIRVRGAHGWSEPQNAAAAGDGIGGVNVGESIQTAPAAISSGRPVAGARKMLRVGLVGYGFMGRAHSNAFARVNQFFDLGYEPVLQAVCARDAGKVGPFAAQWGYQSYETDWRALTERKDIDLIDIASPNDTHAEIAIAAAVAGKMVMCEKPLGRSAAESARMVQAVESAGVPNMVWYNYRRVPAITLAKQLIDEGRLGKIFHYRAKFLQDWTISKDLPQGGAGLWRLDINVAGSGVTGDLLAHCIDTAIWLNGGFERVTAMTETFIKERQHTLTGKVETVGIDDASAFLARFANGSLGTFEATRYARGHKALYTLEINGEDASIAWDLHDLHRLEYFDHRDKGRVRGWRSLHITDGDHPYMKHWWVPGLQIGYEHTFIHQVADFIDGLGTDTPAAPTFREALATDRVTDAVLRSAISGRWENAHDASA